MQRSGNPVGVVVRGINVAMPARLHRIEAAATYFLATGRLPYGALGAVWPWLASSASRMRLVLSTANGKIAPITMPAMTTARMMMRWRVWVVRVVVPWARR